MFGIRVLILLLLFGAAKLFDALNIGFMWGLCVVAFIIMALVTVFKLFNGD